MKSSVERQNARKRWGSSISATIAPVVFIVFAISDPALSAGVLTPHVQQLVDEHVILRLDDILQEIPEEYDGQVLDAELTETNNNTMLYHLRIMKPDGQVLDLVVDAKTAKIKNVLGD